MQVENAVICAAGIGSRLGLDLPKCLVPIGEHRLIYYLLQAMESIKHIWIVVGFKEDEVIRYVKKIRKDVIFVRNPDYRTTTNSYSLHLGSKLIDGPFLNVDGDMILDKRSFLDFVAAVEPGQDLIAYTKAKTEDAVFVDIDEQEYITKFSRQKISEWEWSGIACFSNIKIPSEGGYVYQVLEQDLPLKGKLIECMEIDTPDDLQYLRKNAMHLLQ